MRRDAEVWQPGSAELTFPTDRIDVWRVPLDFAEPPEAEFRWVLAPDEVQRAARFHFDSHRGRYIRCRAALRILLGRYLRRPPEEIRFQYENNGKPEIAYPRDAPDLHFNVSDSGALALIAAGCRNNIGVDIEKLRPMPDLLNIAKRFFSAREVQAILALREHQREEAFFACWTRKEAFLKATGVGLSYPLSKFSVSVDPDGPAALCEVNGESSAADPWFLTDLYPEEGFRGALACDGKDFSIARWSFDPEV